jgi:CoA:oxalate CoA-transferase
MSSARRPPRIAIDTCARRLRALGRLDASDVVEPEITWHGPAGLPPGHPGSEASVQALAGLMEVHGRDQGTPRRLGLEVASVAAGILGAQGALAAAVAHRRGHAVPVVGTSVLQAGLLLLSHYFVVATGLGDALPGPPMPAPGPPFRSADGRWFEIETLDGESWKAFWTGVGAPATELGRGWTVFRWRYERATCSLPLGLHEATVRRSLAELRQVAAAAGVSLAPLRAYDEVQAEPGVFAAHPTVTSRGNGPAGAGVTAGAGPPLAGIRVVEATSRIQGPFAGMLLRMLGAEVVRVQPPEGDYGRAPVTLHRGKETVQLDLGRPAGRAELVELVREADAFLHNWRPGKAAQWGLGFDELARCQPHLVYAEVSGWGDRPPAGDLLGTDFLVQAHTGLGQGLHPTDEPPFPSRMILCDLVGALVAAEGVLAGLYQQEGTGGACEVRSSLVAGAMALHAHVLEDMAAGKEVGRRDGRPVWGILDRPLPTADGLLAVSADDDEAFARLCRVCAVDPGAATRPEIERRIAARLGEDTARRWAERLAGAGIPAAAVCVDLTEVPADPRLSGLFEPVGDGVAPRAPWSFT